MSHALATIPRMKRRSQRRYEPPGAEQAALDKAGEKMAQSLNVPVTHIRYAKYRFHNGQQWTLETRWEWLKDGQWVEVDRDVVKGPGHSSPPRQS